METQLVETKKNQSLVKSFDMTGDLPDLHTDGKIVPADLSSEYWSPEAEGEFRLGFIQPIETRAYPDMNDPEIIVEKDTVFLLAQFEDRSMKTLRNCSARLVSDVKAALADGKIEVGTPVQIIYLGKKKNKTNSYSSDRWSIKPISA